MIDLSWRTVATVVAGLGLSLGTYTYGSLERRLAAVEAHVPHLATLKRALVPDNVVYQFTEPNYLGRFYILEDVTMYVERKRDMLQFNAEEKIGCTIANVRGITRTRFTG